MMKNNLCIAVLGLVALALSGCSFTYGIRQEVIPSPSSVAMVHRWPLAVGVYIPKPVRSKVFSRQAWRVPAGNEISASFIWALEQMFEHVLEIDAPITEHNVPAGLAGVIVLSDVSIGETMPESLEYEISLYSAKGIEIDRWTLAVPRVNWDIQQSSVSTLLQSVGSEFSYSIRNILALFMVEFPHHEAVKTWLANSGISAVTTGPALISHSAFSPGTDRVLLVPNVGTWLYTDASYAMSCIGNRLAQSIPPVHVIPADQVRLEFFPWLEPSTAPKSVEELRSLLLHPAIQSRMREIGARYMLEFHGGTQTEIPKGGIVCGVATGGGGCFGYAWGSRESSFSADILDIRDIDKSFVTSATQRGGVYVPALILPIPIMAPTENGACHELAQRIHALIIKDERLPQ